MSLFTWINIKFFICIVYMHYMVKRLQLVGALHVYNHVITFKFGRIGEYRVDMSILVRLAKMKCPSTDYSPKS